MLLKRGFSYKRTIGGRNNENVEINKESKDLKKDLKYNSTLNSLN